MKRIKDKIRALQEFNPGRTILEVVENRQQEIVTYVTEEQLYGEGRRGSDGKIIAEYDPYSPVTIKIKKAKGQPTDRVTLRDTGAFHKSFRIEVSKQEFEIVATDEKTEKLKTRYGDGVMALTDEHLQVIKEEMLLPELYKVFVKAALT